MLLERFFKYDTGYGYKFSAFILGFAAISMIMVYYFLSLKQLNISSSSVSRAIVIKYIANQTNQKTADGPSLEDLFYLSQYTDYGILLADSSGRILRKSANIKLAESFIKDDEQRLERFYLNDHQGGKYFYLIPVRSLKGLTFFPIILLGVVAAIIIFFFYAYEMIKKSEKNLMWAAMSKETAHQLGTPITSLSGWRDYLAEFAGKDEEIACVVKGLEADLARINLVVSRFSQIAANPEMGLSDIRKVIEDVVEYLQKRLPQRSITIQMELDDCGEIYINRVLIGWVVENLIKNAVQSFGSSASGTVRITLKELKDKVIIDVEDNGSGVPLAIRKKIFQTGFTTKSRGWGIGLSLTKRVVESYHKGKIFLKETTPNKGSTFRIILNRLV